MEIRKEDITSWISWAGAEAMNLRDMLRIKGGKYFMRPMALGGLMIFCAWHYVYKRSDERMHFVQKELDAIQATHEYAEEWKSLKARLEGLRTRLPSQKRTSNDWLLTYVRQSLREEGLVSRSISRPTVLASKGYQFISIKVQCRASYEEIARWIARLERGKELVLVSHLSVKKKERPIGANQVDVTITSVSMK